MFDGVAALRGRANEGNTVWPCERNAARSGAAGQDRGEDADKAQEHAATDTDHRLADGLELRGEFGAGDPNLVMEIGPSTPNLRVKISSRAVNFSAELPDVAIDPVEPAAYRLR
jgi:hypothetical protein